MFWNHSKQHSSKTFARFGGDVGTFWNHSKQHSSKTARKRANQGTHVLEPFETTQL